MRIILFFCFVLVEGSDGSSNEADRHSLKKITNIKTISHGLIVWVNIRLMD